MWYLYAHGIGVYPFKSRISLHQKISELREKNKHLTFTVIKRNK
jgi:hypothetical protein